MYLYILKDIISFGVHNKDALFLATSLKYKYILYLVQTLKIM